MSSRSESPRRRRYTQRIRAERQARTRLRITEAALSLHEEIGPALTTISAVAKRAGVERPTVYRHFPDEASLLGACRDHWLSQNPPPDPGPWIALDDPEERLRVALTQLYSFHRTTAPMTANLLRDASISPAVAEAIAMMRAAFAAIVELLLVGWVVDPDRESIVRAALAHGVGFETWRSLCVTNGLDDGNAVELVIGMVRAATYG
jgi:AcrR family transcriptional regulator